ncbi:O-acetylhomoserine aminocarboxypropyltransferase/cysteine synthase family protein [Halobacterium noricense]|uniref:O-acetylhomoserine aminocarboxypropyltransferase/cysteine synthase family protein n=1 Tax=Halobacterium noricense TaxID=223182 RepID=UPI001E2A1ABF|nr:O-acetylhomoserine aminocarboxypropyltransferase/cysteine synthase family protein [Halobacterium noricense]UHH25378.1 O-acetylhomoserine aminocarboxypropyltransferase/cysteine synthase [Halobacterium noricense]
MTDSSGGRHTRSVHAGQEPDETGARAPPIYQTTSYVFPDADDAAERYALESEADVYSRISNPTVSTLEDRLASLEGGVAAVATNAGMGAIDGITTVLAEAGRNIVASEDMYGGTGTYFSHIAGKRGVDTRTVDALDPAAVEAAIDEDTAFVHVETIANPSLVTPDFEAIADVAHDHAVPLVVDNTFATPHLCRPIEHGADVVWESTTKWLHGAGTTLGGVVVDGGTFPWDHPDADFPELSGENPAYGFDFTERFGDRALAAAVRQRAVRATGTGQTPFDAWQTMQGVETLPLRMDRHCENAAALAAFLADHEDVAWVSYPGHENHPTHDAASEYLDGGAARGASGTSADSSAGGYGGMLTFGPEGGFGAAKAVCEGVELASFAANVGDAKTLVIHPASTTHAQLSEDEQRAAGVRPDMIRVSVGIEDTADVLADFDRALEDAH